MSVQHIETAMPCHAMPQRWQQQKLRRQQQQQQ
jgi:hypothetical protein